MNPVAADPGRTTSSPLALLARPPAAGAATSALAVGDGAAASGVGPSVDPLISMLTTSLMPWI